MGRSPSAVDRRIAARVQAARKALGLTQGACGAALGVSAAQFQKYETAVHRLTGGMLQALADLFGMPVAHLFDAPGARAEGERPAPGHGAGVDAGTSP